MMRKIKSIMLILALILSAGSAVQCSDSDDSSVQAEVKLSKESLSFSGNELQSVLYIQSNVAWTAQPSENWCVIDPVSGTPGTVKISVTLAANSTDSERECEILFKIGNEPKSVVVKQAVADALVLESSVCEIGAEGGVVSATLYSRGEYSLTIADSWVTAADKSKSVSESIEFNVEANNSTVSRETTVTFTLGTLSQVFTIKQAGKSVDGSDYVEPDMTGMQHTAAEIVASMKAAWNLGNTMESINTASDGTYSGNETSWGNPKVTKDFIDKVKAAGFNTIRIPCAWSHNLEADYTIKESWMSRVEEVVGYAMDNDMYVMVNIHWDGGWLENNITADKQVANNEKQAALWKQIAKRFRDYDEHLLFAGTNEPNADDASAMAILKTYQQTFIDAVRATGGKNAYRTLIIQGPNTDVEKTYSYMDMATDSATDRLALEVHYYTPWNFCGMEKDESWGKMSYYWGADNHVEGSSRNSTWGEEDDMKALLDKMYNKYVKAGVPVIIGEYGALKRINIENQEKHDASRVSYFKTFTQECVNRGMVPVIWDNGNTGEFGMCIFNRKTGEVSEPAILEAVMGVYNK